MTLRRTIPLFVALLAACQTELDKRPLRPVEYAVFDPSNAHIPLPNDLALVSASSMPASAQKDLLVAFAAAGGWPNDQEVPLTIDFTRATVNPSTGEITYTAPDLDLTTLSATTVAAIKIAPNAAPAPVALDFAAATYAKGTDRGTLTLRRAVNPATGKRNWDGGAKYVVAIRGGRDGVRVTSGHPDGLQPQPTFYILREAALGDKDLTKRENQGLLPGTDAEKAAAGLQLEALRNLYAPPLQLVDATAFDAHEVALLQTFAVEGGTSVPVDAATGTAPLPFDLLRAPDQVVADKLVPGHILPNPAFGAASAGLSTLDGFSTTGMILAPTSGPIDAATVTGGTVELYKLTGTAAAKVADLGGAIVGGAPQTAAYVTEPGPITQACGIPSGKCASAIGLAPAVPAPVPGVGNFFLPPLEEGTDYAVVVTNGVKDVTGAALKRSTFGKILLTVQSPLLSDTGESTLAGVSKEIAGMITIQKAKLAPVLAARGASDVVMAWTFRTQSITGTSVQLSAAPYNPAAQAAFVPAAPAADPVLGGMTAAAPGVAAFLTTTIQTLDAVNPANGALNPDSTQWALTGIPALVVVPQAANVAATVPGTPLKLAPLVVFHHGLGGGRLQTFALASKLASAGYVVVAIDAPYHGDRAFCTQDSDCASGGVCTPDAAKAGQGDEVAPGTCSTALAFDAARLTTKASGNYFISANFFRTRDGIRQDLIDQSAAVLSFARPPSMKPQGFTDPFANALAQNYGIVIDPGHVYYVGISLGGIIGTDVVATNPRFSRAVLNVAGGPLVDVFTQGTAFQAQVDALFLSLGIDRSKIATDPAVAAAYLKTLTVAKWILDPADPLNFAKHLALEPLPNLLAAQDGSVAQPAKDVLGQAAMGDLVVENPWNTLLYENAGIDWTMYTDADGVVSHGFLGSSGQAQDDVVGWLNALTYPGALVTLQ